MSVHLGVGRDGHIGEAHGSSESIGWLFDEGGELGPNAFSEEAECFVLELAGGAKSCRVRA
jgi:hypothetical protein